MIRTLKKSQIKYVLAIIMSLFFGLFMVKSADAASLPASPRDFYYDQLNILDETTKDLVSNKNEGYKDTNKQPQVVVAAIKSTGDEDIDEYAPDLFEKWHIGQKGEDNGVLILYANNDGRRNVRIEVGYGLEGALTDADAGQILKANAELLKSNNAAEVNKGLQNTFNAVTTLIDKEYGYKGDKNTLSDKEIEKIKNPHRVDMPYAIVIGLLIFAVLSYFGSKNNHGGRGGGSGGTYVGSGLPWWILMGSGMNNRHDNDDFFGGGGFGGGGGFSGGGGSSGGGGASI